MNPVDHMALAEAGIQKEFEGHCKFVGDTSNKTKFIYLDNLLIGLLELMDSDAQDSDIMYLSFHVSCLSILAVRMHDSCINALDIPVASVDVFYAVEDTDTGDAKVLYNKDAIDYYNRVSQVARPAKTETVSEFNDIRRTEYDQLH